MNIEQWNPSTLLQLSGSYWQTCALHAAVKLDIFSALSQGPLSNDVLSKNVHADPRSMAMLLNTITAMGLLQKQNDQYNNTPASQQFLSKHSEQYIGYMILHHHHLMESWAKLPKAVVSGKSVRERPVHQENEVLESFLMGMFNNAMLIAPKVAEHIDLSTSKNLLDLGGGPGTYAIFFCKKNSHLNATVFDLPTTMPFAMKTIERFQLQDRIQFVPGNYEQDEIHGTYDAVWISHILHAEGPEQCDLLIHKAVSALKSNGLIFIHEFILNDDMASPLFPTLFSLNMLLGTANGQAYSEFQIKAMLQKQGVKEIKRLDFKGPNDSGIIMGKVLR
ncbi:MAG: methyltransferase domain-containing protein [Desulfobacterales bacterium]|nr:methyltransferase domain-containing protein [Desulfobacterales bacterium]